MRRDVAKCKYAQDGQRFTEWQAAFSFTKSTEQQKAETYEWYVDCVLLWYVQMCYFKAVCYVLLMTSLGCVSFDCSCMGGF